MKFSKQQLAEMRKASGVRPLRESLGLSEKDDFDPKQQAVIRELRGLWREGEKGIEAFSAIARKLRTLKTDKAVKSADNLIKALVDFETDIRPLTFLGRS